MNVDFFFDPACPWCWITSRWILTVAPARSLNVRWRSFSLLEKNRHSMPPDYLERVRGAHGMLRVTEALRHAGGEGAVAAFYSECGVLHHNDGVAFADMDYSEMLATIGAPVRLATAADDPAWDAALTASIADAVAAAGEDVGVPLIAFEGGRGYFGPVVTPIPTGPAALELWDAVATLGTLPGFYELKNAARGLPEIPDQSFSLHPAAPGDGGAA